MAPVGGHDEAHGAELEGATGECGARLGGAQGCAWGGRGRSPGRRQRAQGPHRLPGEDHRFQVVVIAIGEAEGRDAVGQ